MIQGPPLYGAQDHGNNGFPNDSSAEFMRDPADVIS